MKIYFAGPLFTEAEREWIAKAKGRIEALAAREGVALRLVWPYELIGREEIVSLGRGAKHEIFRRCRMHLDDTDILIALLDGTQVDDGTAWEIGYYYRMKPEGGLIVGIRTDFRRAGEGEASIVNAMIECSCDALAASLEELEAVLSKAFRKGGPASIDRGVESR